MLYVVLFCYTSITLRRNKMPLDVSEKIFMILNFVVTN